MNKIILGVVIGAALGYCVRKMEERGELDQVGDEVNKLASKAKRKMRDVWDKGKNQAEYLSERAENELEKGEESLDNILN
jgi:hypothetical protein